MNTAELTARQIVRINRRDPSPMERLQLAMPWVSESVREDLQRVAEAYASLQSANVILAVRLSTTQRELADLRADLRNDFPRAA